MLNPKIKKLISEAYEIQDLIGHGTFGVVYKGFDKKLKKLVAIKFFTHGTQISKNFINESKLIFRFDHPHVTQALDFFYTDTGYAIVFEYMNQGDLRGYFEQVKHLTEYQTLIIAAQVVTGLSYIHKKGIIHRDLKPENILISSQANEITYKITDFNISSFTSSGKLTPSDVGSPIYMAPEQFYDTYDHRADHYALGVILYEGLAGKPPFIGTIQDVKKSHLSDPVDFDCISVSKRTKEILKKLLEKKQENRYDTAFNLLNDIEETLAFITLPSEHLPLEYIAKKPGLYFLKYLDQSLWPGYVTSLNIKQLKTLV